MSKINSKSKKSKEYCESIKKGEEDVLKLDEVVHFRIDSYQIPYARCLRKEFKSSFLDDDKVNWKAEWINLDYISSNYSPNDPLDYLKDNCKPSMDFYWFQRQMHYCQSLSKEEILTIRGYTSQGDKIINPWLIGNPWWPFLVSRLKNYDFTGIYFPFFFSFLEVLSNYPSSKLQPAQQKLIISLLSIIPMSKRYDTMISLLPKMAGDNWKLIWNDVLIHYHKELNRLILGAPRLTHCMTVWRGSSDLYWTKEISSTGDIILPNFTSTTLDLRMTREFRKDNCCLMRIHLPKNTHALVVMGFSTEASEGEILLPSHSICNVDRQFGDALVQTREYKIESGTKVSTSLCEEAEKVRLSFLIYKGYQM